MAEVNFNLESNYACELFLSCQQESFIAISGISSSIAFLDFLGVNGQNTSLSIITFNLTTDLEFPYTLVAPSTPCDSNITDGTLEGYDGIYTCSCTYCQTSCQAPSVNADIGLFDGFNGALVGYSYLGFILFTIIYQLTIYYACKKKRSGNEIVDDDGRISMPDNSKILDARVNNTVSSRDTSGVSRELNY